MQPSKNVKLSWETWQVDPLYQKRWSMPQLSIHRYESKLCIYCQWSNGQIYLKAFGIIWDDVRWHTQVLNDKGEHCLTLQNHWRCWPVELSGRPANVLWWHPMNSTGRVSQHSSLKPLMIQQSQNWSHCKSPLAWQDAQPWIHQLPARKTGWQKFARAKQSQNKNIKGHWANMHVFVFSMAWGTSAAGLSWQSSCEAVMIFNQIEGLGRCVKQPQVYTPQKWSKGVHGPTGPEGQVWCVKWGSFYTPPKQVESMFPKPAPWWTPIFGVKKFHPAWQDAQPWIHQLPAKKTGCRKLGLPSPTEQSQNKYTSKPIGHTWVCLCSQWPEVPPLQGFPGSHLVKQSWFTYKYKNVILKQTSFNQKQPNTF